MSSTENNFITVEHISINMSNFSVQTFLNYFDDQIKFYSVKESNSIKSIV